MRSERCQRIAQILLLVLSVVNAPIVVAQSFPERPELNEFVSDGADLIGLDDSQQIKALCQKLLTEKQIPIEVVTIPSLAKYNASDIELYARALFDTWGIGSQANNYGVLLLVSLGDRKARIELGGAWAGAQDGTSRMIMDDIIVPNFKQNNYSRGIFQGVQALDTMARGHTVQKPVRRGPILLILGLVALGIGIAISLIRSGHAGWGWALLALIFAAVVGLLAIASRLPSSGGSFGGGSGGGGGATGSW